MRIKIINILISIINLQHFKPQIIFFHNTYLRYNLNSNKEFLIVSYYFGTTFFKLYECQYVGDHTFTFII